MDKDTLKSWNQHVIGAGKSATDVSTLSRKELEDFIWRILQILKYALDVFIYQFKRCL